MFVDIDSTHGRSVSQSDQPGVTVSSGYVSHLVQLHRRWPASRARNEAGQRHRSECDIGVCVIPGTVQQSI